MNSLTLTSAECDCMARRQQHCPGCSSAVGRCGWMKIYDEKRGTELQIDKSIDGRERMLSVMARQ